MNHIAGMQKAREKAYPALRVRDCNEKPAAAMGISAGPGEYPSADGPRPASTSGATPQKPITLAKGCTLAMVYRFDYAINLQ